MKKRSTLVLLTGLTISQPVFAQALEDGSFIEVNVSNSSVTPRYDVIITKWREYYGVIQCRRWNETRGYWVDPVWITAVNP